MSNLISALMRPLSKPLSPVLSVGGADVALTPALNLSERLSAEAVHMLMIPCNRVLSRSTTCRVKNKTQSIANLHLRVCRQGWAFGTFTQRLALLTLNDITYSLLLSCVLWCMASLNVLAWVKPDWLQTSNIIWISLYMPLNTEYWNVSQIGSDRTPVLYVDVPDGLPPVSCHLPVGYFWYMKYIPESILYPIRYIRPLIQKGQMCICRHAFLTGTHTSICSHSSDNNTSILVFLHSEFVRIDKDRREW